MNPSQKLIAVAIDKDRGSQVALKWAVDNLLCKGQTILLIHVKLINNIGSPTPNPINFSPSCPIRNRVLAHEEMDAQTKEMFLPFRVYCTRKDLQCQVTVIEETDVARALAEYVRQAAIEILVIGSPSKTSIFRFKLKDIPGGVMKVAPDFCTVYVISKGRISHTRSASRAAPAANPIHNQIMHQASNASSVSDSALVSSSPKGSSRQFPESSFHGRSNSTKMNNRTGPNGRLHENASAPESDVSFVSFERPVIRSQLPSFSDDFEDGPTPPRLSGLSDMDNRSFESMNIGPSSVDSVTPRELSFVSLDNDSSMSNQMEAEIKRLKQELKHTREMYDTACREAFHANQKHLDMSASSSIYRKRMTMDLRFKNVQCRCKTDVPLRIYKNSEDRKGWLYFKCNKCGFFRWCIPDQATWLGSGLPITPPERTNVEDDLVGEEEVNFPTGDKNFMSMVMENNVDVVKSQSEIIRKMHKLLILMTSLVVVAVAVVALK